MEGMGRRSSAYTQLSVSNFRFLTAVKVTMSDTKANTEPVVDAEKMPPPPTTQQKADLMKLEEEKLKSKFPNLPGRPAAHGGHSSFLQKRLAKGQKFFDSGDYQVINISYIRSPLCLSPDGQAV